MKNHIVAADNILQLAFVIQKKLMRPVIQQAKLEFSPLQLHVLDTLKENGSVTMTMLANEIKMSKQQMTRVVDYLVSQGIVRRDYDEQDRRIIRISLTADGLAQFENIKKAVREVLAAKLAAIDGKKLAELDRAATELARLIKELS